MEGEIVKKIGALIRNGEREAKMTALTIRGIRKTEFLIYFFTTYLLLTSSFGSES